MQKKNKDGEYREYFYDSLNRLSSIQDNAFSMSFSYDPWGQRLTKTHRANQETNESKTVYVNGVFVKRDGLANMHLHDGQYVFGTIIPGHEELTLYFAQDHLGSTVLVADSRGRRVQRRLYTPFGKTWINETAYLGSGVSEPERMYTNQILDESGLYYYNARYYDPQLGLFLTTDPALDGLNHYVYAYGNPVIYTDPTGEVVWTPIIAGGIIGGVFGAAREVLSNPDATGYDIFRSTVTGMIAGAAGGVGAGLAVRLTASLGSSVVLGGTTYSMEVALGYGGGAIGGGGGNFLAQLGFECYESTVPEADPRHNATIRDVFANIEWSNVAISAAGGALRGGVGTQASKGFMLEGERIAAWTAAGKIGFGVFSQMTFDTAIYGLVHGYPNFPGLNIEVRGNEPENLYEESNEQSTWCTICEIDSRDPTSRDRGGEVFDWETEDDRFWADLWAEENEQRRLGRETLAEFRARLDYLILTWQLEEEAARRQFEEAYERIMSSQPQTIQSDPHEIILEIHREDYPMEVCLESEGHSCY